MSAPSSTAAARRREVLPGSGAPPGAQRWTNAERWWVFALAALVAGLCCWRLGTPTFWNDEAATWAIAGHGFGDLLHVLATSGGDRGAALYYLVAFAWMRVFGTTEVAVRSLSVVAAAVAIVPFHAVARRVVSQPAAWAAGLFFATSSFVVTYARDARTYSFALCLVLLAAWTFLRAIESARWRDWWVFVAVALIAIGAHWFSALIVVSLYLSLAIWRRPLGVLRRPVVVSGVVLAVGVLPIAAQLAVGANSGLEWVAPLNAAELRAVVSGFTGTTAPIVQLAIGAVAIAGFVAAWSERAARRVPPVVVTWLVVPVIATIAVSEITPVLVTRYLIVALPGFAFLVGLGVAMIARGRIFAAVACSAVVAVLGLHGFSGLWSSSRGGEDWRSIVASVSTRARPTDAIVVFPATAVSAYSYYARDQSRIAGRDGPTWPSVHWNSPFTRSIANSTVLRSDLTDRSGVWLVVRAPHGGTVARGVQESPVLGHLEHQLGAAYREATVEPPWTRHDTVYVIHYSDAALR